MRADEKRLKVLFTRGLAGDQAAYREFLSELSLLLRGYIRRQLLPFPGAQNNVEDVLQEALFAVHSKRHTHDQEVPVTAWAYAIARYKLIDFLRATKRSDAEISLEVIPEMAGEQGARIEEMVTIRNILASLPERFRIPIELVKVEGLSVAEAAFQTGISEGAIKVNVHRGLKMMARLLG